jgi:hypothetical protein
MISKCLIKLYGRIIDVCSPSFHVSVTIITAIFFVRGSLNNFVLVLEVEFLYLKLDAFEFRLHLNLFGINILERVCFETNLRLQLSLEIFLDNTMLGLHEILGRKTPCFHLLLILFTKY